MGAISFIEEPKTIDRIIGYLELSFQAARPPPPHKIQQELLPAAEEMGKYFWDSIPLKTSDVLFDEKEYRPLF